jgi:hypothetical protein
MQKRKQRARTRTGLHFERRVSESHIAQNRTRNRALIIIISDLLYREVHLIIRDFSTEDIIGGHNKGLHYNKSLSQGST